MANNARHFSFSLILKKKKPLICPLENSAQQGIYFDILGKRNCTISPQSLPLNFTKHPMPFSRYQQGFELVQSELQKGNSYLLNLTYPTEISGNLSLEQIFHQTNAPYKLWLQDQFCLLLTRMFYQYS